MICDSSLVVSFLEPTDFNHERAVKWMESAAEAANFSAPSLLRVEVVAAFVRRKKPSLDAISWIEDAISLEEVSIPQAEALAQEVGLRAGDAFFAALARRSGQELVTFDKDQAERATKAGIKTIFLGE